VLSQPPAALHFFDFFGGGMLISMGVTCRRLRVPRSKSLALPTTKTAIFVRMNIFPGNPINVSRPYFLLLNAGAILFEENPAGNRKTHSAFALPELSAWNQTRR